MLLSRLLVLLAVVATVLPAATIPLYDRADEGGGIRTELVLEHDGGDTATLVARYHQLPAVEGEHWHLYGHGLAETGVEFMPGAGLGRPTKVTVRSGDLRLLGEPESSVPAVPYDDPNLGVSYPVYRVTPKEPLVHRYPVRLPPGDGATVPVELGLWYMFCDEDTGVCLQSRSGTPVEVQVPTATQVVPLEKLPLHHEVDEGAGVAVDLTLEHGSGADAVLEATFTPVAEGEGWHLYSRELPETGLEGVGLGRPTKVTLPPGQPLRITGEPTASVDPVPFADPNLGITYPVYPSGPVTLRYPVTLPAGGGVDAEVTLALWYMLCNEETCLRPASGREVTVRVPTASDGAEAREVPPPERGAGGSGSEAHALPEGDAERAIGPWWRALAVAALVLAAAVCLGLLPRREGPRRAGVLGVVAALVAITAMIDVLAGFAPPTPRGSGIPWVAPTTVAGAEAAIAEAHAAGEPALLDFTGPACPTCLAMAKAHFAKPAVRAAWASGVPIELDTDTHPELAAWQLERFGTQERPLYVRIEPDGESARWNTFVRDGDEAGVARLVAFLDGSETGGGDLAEGWGAGAIGLVVVAVLGGLFTLLMPCTYPMIPLTVTFFSKQAEGGRSLPPLAACYAGGIVLCFTALGLIVSGIFEVAVSNVAGNPWTNLAIGSLFVVFGLSLLGAFLLQLPPGLTNALGGGKAGYAGALVMGLTFAVTAFTCTAPIAGLVLGEAMRDGTWVKATVTMAIYAATIALPFFFLAISPRALSKLPRSGAWMGEFKVVGGLVEIAAAFKFLAVTDNAWGWQLMSRDLVLAIWAACALVAACYIAGLVRMRDDAPVRAVSRTRLLLVLAFAALAAWFLGGALGTPLSGVIEGLIPYMHQTPSWDAA